MRSGADLRSRMRTDNGTEVCVQPKLFQRAPEAPSSASDKFMALAVTDALRIDSDLYFETKLKDPQWHKFAYWDSTQPREELT